MTPTPKPSKGQQQGTDFRLRVRRPNNFYASFNTWWRELKEKLGRRPNIIEIRQWYADNAKNEWPDEERRPSVEEVEAIAKGLRSKKDVQAYFQAHRQKKKAERQACEMDKSGKPAAMETDSDPFSGASKAAVLPPARESIRPLLVAAAPQPAAAGASITYASVLPVLQQMPTSPVSLGLSNHTEIIANVAGGTIACKSSPHGLTAASAAAPAPPTRPRTPSPDRHEPVGPREPLSQPRELQAQLQLHHLHHPDYRQPHHLQPIFPSPTTRLVRQAEVKWNSATTVAWCGPAAGSSNTALPPYNPVYISRPAANRQHGFVGHPTEPPPPQPVYYMLQPVRVAAFSSQSRPQYPEPVHDSGSFEPVTPARARPSASYKPYMAPPASYMAPPAPYMAPPAAGHFLDLPCRSELAVSRSAAAAAVPLVVTETQCGSQLRPPEWVVAVEDGGFLDALLSADQDDADDSCDSSS